MFFTEIAFGIASAVAPEAASENLSPARKMNNFLKLRKYIFRNT